MSVFSIIWKSVGCELLPSQTLPSEGTHTTALTYVRTSFFLCNSAISHAYYDCAASLHPEQYLLCRGMLCVKHSCPAHSAVLRQDSGQHLTYRVSPSKVLSTLYERQAFFQFPEFLRTLTFLHKTRLSLRDFHLFTGMCLIFSQLLSFLLIFPY